MPSAVGIVRVSQTKGRKGESFYSPKQQRDRIEAECARQGLTLLEIHEELDVSGGNALEKRPGLRRAVLAVEAGEADVIVAAYLDRLTRSIRVREEVIERVEAAGGMVLTVDMGVQTNGTAGQWLTGTLSSAVGEYLRRTTAERSAEAQQRSINRGVPPWPAVPPGYRARVIAKARNGRNIHGPFQVDEREAAIVREAFELRASGETIANVRVFMSERGVKRSYRGIQSMLGSRVYLGQIHFGRYEPNLEAHPRLITDELWHRVQAITLTRGRRASSRRLLARQGILRCGTCSGRLVVGHTTSPNGKRYPFYRCSPTGDCPRRVTISAERVENAAVAAVLAELGDLEGKASAEANVREAELALERAQADLDSVIRTLGGLEDEPVARERLTQLRETRDLAQAHLDRLSSLEGGLVIRLGSDWGRLGLNEQQAILRATVERIAIAPGRSADRITISLFSA